MAVEASPVEEAAVRSMGAARVPERTSRRRGRGRVPPRVLVAVLAGLLAMVASVAVLVDRRATVQVLVATRAIPAGEELAGATQVRTVPASGGWTAVLIPDR